MIQWFRLPASTAGDTDLIPGWGTKILRAMPSSMVGEGEKKAVFLEMKNNGYGFFSNEIFLMDIEILVSYNFNK